jgi:hypothetical protein
MKAIKPCLWLLGAAMPAIGAAAGPFDFDRRQAIDMAVTLVRTNFAKHPAAAIPGVDFEHPLVTAVRTQPRRDFIFVSFASSFAQWGAYAIFEVCGPTARVVANGVGKVIDIGDFRAIVAGIGPKTRLALPDVCSKSPGPQ